MYDVIIAGGSIAGLFCAREIAKENHTVLVIEEDFEVGTPEHCGGLVSLNGLQELGIIPSPKTLENQITSATITSPDNREFVINSEKQNITVINRREFDKQIALQAQRNGAEIQVKTSFSGYDGKTVKTSAGNFECKQFVDCRGATVLVNQDRAGALQCAQYEIYADWIKKGRVEVNFDQEKFPGFFAWVIPAQNGMGKVGVAGRGINVTKVMDEFLKQKGSYSTIRKIFAPIWVRGPVKQFITEGIITVGDAAGQSKPTTAGGIYSCGMAGIFAGRAISEFLKTGDKSHLEQYQKRWSDKFGSEFEKQLLARKLLEKLDNNAINKLFDSVTPEILKEMSEKDDFDFHTGSIIKLLGIRKSISAAQAILGGEIKRLLSVHND